MQQKQKGKDTPKKRKSVSDEEDTATGASIKDDKGKAIALRKNSKNVYRKFG